MPLIDSAVERDRKWARKSHSIQDLNWDCLQQGQWPQHMGWLLYQMRMILSRIP